MNDIKKINLKTLTIMISLFTMVLSTTKVYAVDKIEAKTKKDNIIYFRWCCSLNISSFNNKFCYRYIGVICYKC